MRFAIVLLAISSAQAAAIDGIVLNGGSNKPQAGSTVTLYRVGGANGPEAVESVKTNATGKFSFDKEFPGPRLLQAAYDGVTYNQMLPPGAPSQGVTVKVYESSKKQGVAHVEQHAMILEPSNGQLVISEIFVWQNDGNTTFNDPDKGTLEFFLPPGAAGKVEVNVLAPQGMPIRRAPDKTSKPNVYKIDFPIKPGQSRMDLSYQVPFTSPGEFTDKVFYKGGATQIVVPNGVTLAGPGVKSLGPGPANTNSQIFGIDGAEFTVAITGSGSLRGEPPADGAADQNQGPSIAQVMPRLFQLASPNASFPEMVGLVKWIVLVTFAILALGFALLYRAGTGERTQEVAKAKSGSNRR